jgi:hypothetical protein
MEEVRDANTYAKEEGEGDHRHRATREGREVEHIRLYWIRPP